VSDPVQHILVVEDNEADVFLVKEAIREAGLDVKLDVARDGEQALRLFEEADLDESAPRFALVILDINLPRKQGNEVLASMRQSARCGNAPVIATSSSESPHDREAMMMLGANIYFHKPTVYDEYMKLGKLIKSLF
jgi:DNA-binding response OmpR family regulator